MTKNCAEVRENMNRGGQKIKPHQLAMQHKCATQPQLYSSIVWYKKVVTALVGRLTNQELDCNFKTFISAVGQATQPRRTFFSSILISEGLVAGCNAAQECDATTVS